MFIENKRTCFVRGNNRENIKVPGYIKEMERNNEIQVQASSCRSLGGVESSVQRSNQDRQLTDEALQTS